MTSISIEPVKAAADSDPGQGVSIVRRNLMERAGYSPYCGNFDCRLHMPRTTWDGRQFKCGCGWRSEFPADFVTEYKAKWGK